MENFQRTLRRLEATLCCRLLAIGPSYVLVGMVSDSPIQRSPKTHRTGQSLTDCPLYTPRRDKAPFSNGRLDAVDVFIVKGSGVLLETVGVGSVSVLEISDASEEVAVYRSDISEVLLAKLVRHTPIQQGLRHICH